MSPHMNKCRPTGRNSEPLFDYTFAATASHKRKRQDRDGQDLQPPKRNKGPLQIQWSNAQSPDQSLDRKSPDSAQAPVSFEASITQAATDEDPQDLPELTYSNFISPPDTDELHSMDDLCLSENVLQKELHRELEWLKDLSKSDSDEPESPLPSENVLLSQYLRSRSPSYFSAQGIDGNHDSDRGIYSETVTSGDICLCAEEEPHLADLVDPNTAKPKNIPVKTNKPRITLRIRQPKPGPTPKVFLRLSQPKQAPTKRSVRQGIKNRRRRRT